MDLPYRSTLIALLLLLVGSAEGLSQGELSLHGLDITSFTTIKAKLLAIDVAGNLISGLRPEDVTVTENGIPRTVTRLACSAGQLPQPLSIAISFDLSSSMQVWRSGSGEEMPFTLGQHALRYLAGAVPLPRSELALQGFDNDPVGGIPLTRDRSLFLQEVDGLPMMFNNEFNHGLFDPKKGTINVVKSGAHRKVAILVSDDDCTGLGDIALIQRYIDTCAKYSIRFYAIIFRSSASNPFMFQSLVDATGGRLYDRLTSRAQAEAAIQDILEREQGGVAGSGCEIEWESVPGCPALREVVVTIPGHSLSARTEYNAPAATLPELHFEPSGLAFGPMPPGSTRTIDVTVTASQFAVTVYSIDSIAPPFSIDGLSLPFTLQPGESRTLRIRFTPTDSTLSFGQFRFNRDQCPPVVFDLSGGLRRRPESLRVIAPNGGEKLLAGSTATLKWTGAAAGQPVRLEYSIDRGRQWRTIIENASGLEYLWRVPFTPSDSCLLRASFTGESARRVNFLDTSGHHNWCAFSPANTLVAVANNDLSVSLRDASTAVEVRRLVGHLGMVWWVEFSPDGRYLLSTGFDSRVIVWEVATGRVMQVLDGHHPLLYMAAFSPDGGRIVAANDQSTIIWSVETGEKLKEFPNDSYTFGVRFNHDGSRVAVISQDVVIRDAFSGAELHRIPLSGGSRYVEFSDDGSLLLIVLRSVVAVYETATWTRLGVIRTSGSPESVAATFRSGDNAILTMSQYVMELWESRSLQLLAQLPTNGVGATNASFSGDGRRLVSVTLGSGTIWDLGGAGVGADISDSLWSIVLPEEPEPLVGDFAMGKDRICQGECIEPAATTTDNIMSWEWTFEGGLPDRGSGVLPGRICYPRAGRYPVQLIVSNATQRDTIVRYVTVGAPPPAPTISECGTTLTASAAPNYQWFRDGARIDGAGSQQLRYDRPGTYSVEITSPEGCIARSAPFVTGDEGISNMTVAVGPVEAAPGEIVQVPLSLRFSRPGAGAPYRLTLRLAFNASLLLPVDHTPSAAKGGRRSIEITVTGDTFGDTIVSIPFHVALGDSPSTTLTVDTVGVSMDCPIDLRASGGLFSLGGLCTSGGTRLVATADASKLRAIRPNPVRGEATIEYSLVESGMIDIALFDLSGRRVATIVSGASVPGGFATTYDLAGLPAGRYLCVYTTPTERFSEALIVE